MEKNDIFWKTTTCSALAAFSHVTQESLATGVTMVVGLFSAITMLPKVLDSIQELSAKLKNWWAK
jgi:hypothetical protein